MPVVSGKVCDDRLRWSNQRLAALAFKVNGRQTIEAYSHGIDLPSGQHIELSEDRIAADYRYPYLTNTAKLRDLFGLQATRLPAVPANTPTPERRPTS
jgi:hypothetical protein